MDNKKHILFGGCGGMYHYFLGVARVIQQKLDISDIIFSGVSAGNVPAMLLALNIDIDTYFNENDIPFLKEVGNKMTKSVFNWNMFVKKLANKILPNDVHKTLSNNYKFYITTLPYIKSKMITQWNSKENFIDTFIGSSFMPIFDRKLYQTLTIDNKIIYCIDGAMSNYKQYINEDITLQLSTDMWREGSNLWMYPYTDIEWAKTLYKWGQDDALKNIKTFEDFGLKQKDYILKDS